MPSPINLLFTERFQPKKLSEVILQERIFAELGSGVVFDHWLFHGNPGIGKSLTARIIAKSYNHRVWNASSSGRIDILRNEVTDYVEQVQFGEPDLHDGIKLLVFEEIDGASKAFFDALRSFMDEYEKKIRIIATCNYIDKIPEANQSRFTKINFNFLDKKEELDIREKHRKRIGGILRKVLKIEIGDPELELLLNKVFPDFRQTLKFIQRMEKSGKKVITAGDIKEAESEFLDLYTAIFKKTLPEDAYKMVMANYQGKVDSALESLGDGFIRYLIGHEQKYCPLIPEILRWVFYYQAERHNVYDMEMALVTCVLHIQSIISNYKK